jgi:hypothetical protein
LTVAQSKLINGAMSIVSGLKSGHNLNVPINHKPAMEDNLHSEDRMIIE